MRFYTIYRTVSSARDELEESYLPNTELSSSNRAVCQATDCKTAKTKIEKGVLRMGTWVTYEDTGSWKWRHWGCITGKVLQNIRSGIADPNNPGQYLWDWLDGYDGEDKNGLQGSPDLQAKVRRVITQGFIDPEDWRGVSICDCCSNDFG